MIPILVATLIVVNAVVLTKFSDTSQKLVEQQSMTVKTKDSLRTAEKHIENIEIEKVEITSSLKEERLKNEELSGENQTLKANLQAKKEAQLAKTQEQSLQLTSQKQGNAVAVSGTCEDWLAQAGITDLVSARELLRRESGCNPNAVNPSSGACGLAQELPCGKSGCSLGDGACQMAWMKRYVEGRYGSFAAAISFHNANNWY